MQGLVDGGNGSEWDGRTRPLPFEDTSPVERAEIIRTEKGRIEAAIQFLCGVA